MIILQQHISNERNWNYQCLTPTRHKRFIDILWARASLLRLCASARQNRLCDLNSEWDLVFVFSSFLFLPALKIDKVHLKRISWFKGGGLKHARERSRLSQAIVKKPEWFKEFVIDSVSKRFYSHNCERKIKERSLPATKKKPVW